jgi:RimJ/RimL family protein N-acetyltransferase
MAALDEREGGYRYVALRRDDLEPLRGFRNAQLRVLRQNALLTPEDQERYWREHVVPEHASPAPRSLVVSILEDNRFVGYGGLTNLDWEDGRAEISFLVDPRRADDGECYARDLSAFLAFVQRWAFGPLGLHRLFTETYAFREAHIALLEAAGLRLEGRLRDQIRDPASGAFADSVIHAVLGQGDE